MLCLPKDSVDSFKQALVSRKLNPKELASMSSAARHKLFSEVVGDSHAKYVNSLFESKTLLKNQQRGYLTWAKNVANITPAARRTMMDKIANLDRVLDPEDEKMFLKDLASTRLGFDVTADEAKKIAELSRRVQETKTAELSTKEAALEKNWKPSVSDLNYGRARYDFNEHISNLKNDANKLRLSDLKGKGVLQVAPMVTKGIFDTSKSIGASLDDSFALRQGAKAFWTNNRLWQKQFVESFKNIAKGLKSTEAVNREFNSHMMADPHYDEAIKNGLALRGNEDAFPTSLPEKIPVFGRAFGASEVAYNAFAQNLRLSIYKKQMALAQDMGKEVPENYGKNMAKMVNSLTGRGGFGSLEPASNVANVAFYSLRFLKSNVDTLLLHPAGLGVGGTLDAALGKEGARVASEAQVKAATNLAKIVIGTAGVLATAKALKPDSVDYDPRSSNFGKIKIGDTRFDVSGGMASIVELASQLATSSTKSSTTGVITKLNTGDYGGQTQLSVIYKFLQNKASPVGGVALDKLQNKDHNGNPFSLKTEAKTLVTPLGVKNYQELKSDPNSANILAAVLADTFGIAANTYGKSNKNAQQKLGAEETALKQKIGADKFNQVLQQYNTRYDNALKNERSNLDKLDNETKASTISGVKRQIWKDLYKENDFKPKRTKRGADSQSIINSVKR